MSGRMSGDHMYEHIWWALSDEGIANSNDAVNLLSETTAVESAFGKYNKQIGGGPALGIFQMEPNTRDDIINNYIRYRPYLHKFKHGDLMDEQYAIIMARIHYLRVRSPIPSDRLGRAYYWKKYFNTYKGKGSIRGYMEKCERYIGKEVA